MNDKAKSQLKDLLNIYYNDVEADIENADDGDEDTSALDDLLTSIDDVRTSLN